MTFKIPKVPAPYKAVLAKSKSACYVDDEIGYVYCYVSDHLHRGLYDVARWGFSGREVIADNLSLEEVETLISNMINLGM